METRKATRVVLWGIVLGHWLFGLIFGLLIHRIRSISFGDYSLAILTGLITYWTLVSAAHFVVLSGTLAILRPRGYRLHRGGRDAPPLNS